MIVRTERDIKYRAMSSVLRDAGYVAISKPLMQPYRLYGLLMVACNVIGEMMSVHPFRVWQALYIRVRRATAGVIHKAGNSSYIRAGVHQDTDDLHILCPCCGYDLLTAGPPTFDEIAAGMKARTARKSPHSTHSEVENLPCKGKSRARKGKSRGTRGTGGWRPDRGGETVR